jgi:hypothetical protein
MGVADSMSKKHRISFIAVSLMAVSLLPAAKAQENNNSKPEEAATSAIAKKVINLWPGVAPGSEQWKQPEANLGSGGMETTVNVSTPTLTAYLPAPSTATGTAVIIAPGGGFIGLSINSEGHDAARCSVVKISNLKSASVQVSRTELDWLVGMSHGRLSVPIRNDLWITSE